MEGTPTPATPRNPSLNAPSRRSSRPVFLLAVVLLCVIGFGLAAYITVARWRSARALEIENRSESGIGVTAYADSLGYYIAQIQIPPGSTKTLRTTSFWSSPDYISIGEGPFGRSWICRWDEVTENGGLVWSAEGANCGEERP
jgi:hypothetical protein